MNTGSYNLADRLSHDRLAYIFAPPQQKEKLSDWNSHRDFLYTNGPIYGLFREKNNLFMDCLKIRPTKFIRSDLVELLNWFKENEDKRLPELTAQFGGIPVYFPCPELTEDNIIDWVKAYNSNMLIETEALSDSEKMMFLYLYIGYKYYESICSSHLEIDQPNLSRLYRDLHNSNYRRYGLIPVDQDRELIIIVPAEYMTNYWINQYSLR